MKAFFCFLLICGQAYTAEVLTNPVTTDIPKAKQKDALVAEELAVLDRLIGTTQRNLEAQKKLREQIVAYQKLLGLYLQNEGDKELLFRVANSASIVNNTIQDNHLSQVFDADFLSELSLFAGIAEKRGIPRP